MNKIVKRVIVLAVVAALVGGGVFASIKYRDSKKATIEVYPVSELAEEEYWEDAAETYGTVRSDRVQAVYLSTSQKVEEVKVTEGQQVKKGDVLMTYDTTLSKVEVDRAKLDLQKLQEEMKKYQSDLEKVKKYRPGVGVPEKDQVEIEGYESDGSFDDDVDDSGDDDEMRGAVMVLSAGGGDTASGSGSSGEGNQEEVNDSQQGENSGEGNNDQQGENSDEGNNDQQGENSGEGNNDQQGENSGEGNNDQQGENSGVGNNDQQGENSGEGNESQQGDNSDEGNNDQQEGGSGEGNESQQGDDPGQESDPAQDAVNAVIEMIDQLSDPITLEDEDAIADARAAYENLTDEQKALVTNLDKLEQAEKELVDLQAADAVDELIAAIPEEITLEDEDAIEDANKAYEALTEDQKKLVKNYEALEAAIETLKALRNGWPVLKAGEGTEKNPFVYEWNSKCTPSQKFLAYISNELPEAYVTFQVMDSSKKDELVTEWTTHIRTLVTNDETTAYAGDKAAEEAKKNPAPDYTEELVSDMVKSSFETPYYAYDFVKKDAKKTETEESTTEAPSTEEPATEKPSTEAPTKEDPTETSPTESQTESETESATETLDPSDFDAAKDQTGAVKDPSDDPDYPDGDDDDDGSSVTYTAKEISEMRNTLEASLRDLDLDIRMAQLDVRKKEMELNNGEVLSEIDGTVRTLRDAEQSQIDNQAFIEIVGGGGGYYISSTVGELDLDTVKIGQPINVVSYETGESSVGEVSDISHYPVSGQYYDGTGNSNVSYYPFKVFVKDDASFQNGEFVQLTYDDTYEEDSDSFYLMNSMMRTENGKTYVYVRDENGQLKKQTVKTGKVIWGSYTEIMSGLSIEDYVAFPYGNDVKEGCPTKEGSTDALWEGDY